MLILNPQKSSASENLFYQEYLGEGIASDYWRSAEDGIRESIYSLPARRAMMELRSLHLQHCTVVAARGKSQAM
jgi:hypothetical protein